MKSVANRENLKLSVTATAVAECFAVIYPERPARTKVMQWINRARKNLNGERGINNDELKTAIEELVAAGLLQPSIEAARGVVAKGPSAMPGTITLFCEAAIQRGIADLLLAEMEAETNRHYYASLHAVPAHLEQQLRLALIRDNFAAYMNQELPAEIWLWLTEPLAKPYLERLPEPHRGAACAFGLQWLTHFFQPMDVFAKTCELVSENAICRVLIARAKLFQGEFTQCSQYIEKALSLASADSKPVQMEAQALQALLQLLQGDDESAMESIEATLSIERSGTRKRIVYPDTQVFSIALLSLIRRGTPASRELFSTLLAARKKLKFDSPMDTLFLAADEAERPRTHFGPMYHCGAPSVFSVLFAIGSRWHSDYHLPEDHAGYRSWVESLIRRAHAGGYAWVVAELLTVAENSFGKDSPLADDVHALLLTQDGEARHQALGTKTLTKLVQALEPWEYSMRELEQLALKAKKPKVPEARSGSSASRRLVWQLTPGYGGYVEVTPLEQTLDKKGQWSAGRRVALKRLREQTSSMPHLNAQDIAASGTIQKTAAYGWGGGSPTFETTQRTVYQLVGHPYIFDEDGQRYDLLERPAEIRLSDHDQQVRLSFEPEFNGSAYRSELDAAQLRVYVTHFTAAQQRIHAAIPTEGLNVPSSASDRLQKLATTLAGDISVLGSTDAASAALQLGNPEPLLALEPYGSSLRVRIRVEPSPESNVFFDAGTGGTVVHVSTVDGTVSLQRDLGQEQTLVLELITRSAVLSEHYNGLPFFVLDDTVAALELLSDLQDAGIRCVWPGEIPFRIKAQADVGQVSLNISSATDWFAASGTVMLGENGEDSMPLERLLELMASRPESRFVPLGKDEFLALSKTLHQQLSALRAFALSARGDAPNQHFHPMAAIALEPLLDGATVTSDKAWKRTQKNINKALTDSIDVPSTLQADLREYQVEGFVWMARLGMIGAGACLADDMGLGKTLQSLALLLHRASSGPALVVAPTSVAGNWLQEAQRFAPSLNVLNYAQAAGERQRALDNLDAFDVIVISYGLLFNDIKLLEQVHWHTIVLDEAQAIKNAATGRAKATKQLKADFRVITTGTPVQNNLMDLHSLFGFLNPRLLGSESAFRKRFALPISRDQDIYAREQLQSLVSPFLLRRQKREVLRELPSRTELTLEVSLSPEEAALYETIRLEALASLEANNDAASINKQKMQILSYLTKLRRLCCNPVLVEPSWSGPASKLALFAETIGDLIASGHNALVFSQFVDHLQIVKRHLDEAAVSYQYLDGKTPAKQRTERVKRFQSGEGDVFLISLTAGGTGLNLTAADYVIHLDPWWNPAVEDQASDRAHRLGQQRPVTILRMVTIGTIEEQIQALHGSKRELADSILAGSDTPSLDAQRMMALLQTNISGHT